MMLMKKFTDFVRTHGPVFQTRPWFKKFEIGQASGHLHASLCLVLNEKATAVDVAAARRELDSLPDASDLKIVVVRGSNLELAEEPRAQPPIDLSPPDDDDD